MYNKSNLFSIVKDNSRIIENFKLEIIVEAIRSNDRIKEKTLEIRSNPEKKGELKKKLLGFTPSGKFDKVRKTETLIEYSGLISLDFDNLLKDELNAITAKMPKCHLIKMGFTSVSGKGYRLFIQTNASKEQHKICFEQLCKWAEEYFGVYKVDRNISSIAQQCYFSHDPDVYYNPKSELFEVQSIPKDSISNRKKTSSKSFTSRKSHVNESDNDPLYESIRKKFETKNTFVEGNRNNFIFSLALKCNSKGLPIDKVIDLISKDYDFKENPDNREVVRTIQSAYDYDVKELPDEGIEEGYKFEDNIYEGLPPFLRELCELFDEGHEKDVFLVGALTIISGCFPTVFGEYNKEKIYPNLFSFIIAPPASGKGVVKKAGNLANQLNTQVFEFSKARYSECNADEENQGPCPPTTMLFVPANNSSSGLIENLKNNGGWGIIIESEADSLGNNLKKEWGDNLSAILRKAFHHEKIDYNRKTQEAITIEEPKLSVVFTCTPNQIFNFMTSAENGLYSRLLFYSFSPKQEWKSARPSKDSNAQVIDTKLGRASDMITKLHNEIDREEVEFVFSEKQWDEHDKIFKSLMTSSAVFNASVKRMGLIVFRIAMILSIVRNINGIKGIKLGCLDIDFEIAIEIGKIFLNNSSKFYDKISYTKKDNSTSQNELIFSKLPKEFTTDGFIRILENLKFSERTAQRKLKEGIGKYWSKISHGNYEKL